MAEMVELKNIQKSFGSNHILKGVNMSIGKGEVVVFSDRPVQARQHF